MSIEQKPYVPRDLQPCRRGLRLHNAVLENRSVVAYSGAVHPKVVRAVRRPDIPRLRHANQVRRQENNDCLSHAPIPAHALKFLYLPRYPMWGMRQYRAKMSCLDSTTRSSDHAGTATPPAPDSFAIRRRILSALVLVALFLAVEFLLPRPASVTPAGWRLLGIFVATVGALMLQPIPGGAAVLIAVLLASIFGGLTIQQALGGYGDPTVWLVMAAFSISN